MKKARRKKVLQMYKNGVEIGSIAELIGISRNTVRNDLAIMGVLNLPVRYSSQLRECMTIDYVIDYKHNHPPGSMANGAKILRDNGYTVLTNEGTLQWKDLALRQWKAEHGERSDDISTRLF